MVSYNRIENYGFYGGAFGLDGAAVELDGEDPTFNAHDIHIHHNVSINTKGGFLEIAGNSRDIVVDHNVSDDVDKFVGTNGIRNLRIVNNTVIRTRIPDISMTDVWSLRSLFWAVCWNGCKGDRDKGVVIAGNIFYVDKSQRIFLSADNPHGFMSAVHANNLYWSPDGDAAKVLGQPLGDGETVAKPVFRNPADGDFSLLEVPPGVHGTYGAYAPGTRSWQAGIEPHSGSLSDPR
ncbi:MAG: hypothetical protein LOX97_07405 [Sphingomonas sp.]|nr:hypothetical protein [Sphingomonas sp.]